MPFTPCHAAAAVPLRRLGLPLSALVIGSMSPDFLYYLYFVQHSTYGHTWAGLILFDLPASLVLLAVFHGLLKWPLLALFPEVLQERLETAAARPFEWRGRSRLLLIVIAVLIGAVSHIVWDGFTHLRGWAVQLLPALTERVTFGPVRMRIFYILQDLSTVIGGALLLLWSVQWLRRAPARPVTPRLQRSAAFKVGWLLALFVPAMVAGFTVSIGILSQSYNPIRRFIVSGLIETITALVALVMVYALIWRFQPRSRSLTTH